MLLSSSSTALFLLFNSVLLVEAKTLFSKRNLSDLNSLPAARQKITKFASRKDLSPPTRNGIKKRQTSILPCPGDQVHDDAGMCCEPNTIVGGKALLHPLNLPLKAY